MKILVVLLLAAVAATQAVPRDDFASGVLGMFEFVEEKLETLAALEFDVDEAESFTDMLPMDAEGSVSLRGTPLDCIMQNITEIRALAKEGAILRRKVKMAGKALVRALKGCRGQGKECVDKALTDAWNSSEELRKEIRDHSAAGEALITEIVNCVRNGNGTEGEGEGAIIDLMADFSSLEALTRGSPVDCLRQNGQQIREVVRNATIVAKKIKIRVKILKKTLKSCMRQENPKDCVNKALTDAWNSSAPLRQEALAAREAIRAVAQEVAKCIRGESDGGEGQEADASTENEQ